jgi:hypothetical protein
VSVQVLPQVFNKPSADSSRKFHALFRYTVLLLASTKQRTECVALFDTSFVLHVNLKLSPSFVKLSQFEKLKLKCALGISRLYMYELNCRGVTEFLLLHIASWMQSTDPYIRNVSSTHMRSFFPHMKLHAYICCFKCSHMPAINICHTCSPFTQICCLHCYAHVQLDLLWLVSTALLWTDSNELSWCSPED